MASESNQKKEAPNLSSMVNNMYRVGDYVYFEQYASSPYNIRRIEELNKTASGTVEAKVLCYFRRRDLPLNLLKIADKAEHQSDIFSRQRRNLITRKSISGANGVANEDGDNNGGPQIVEDGENEKDENAAAKEKSYGLGGLPKGADKLDANQVHMLRQHELFLSRQNETLPATQIRGKCSVVMLNEVEECGSYLNREDCFFYSLVYDAQNRTLLADKGSIEVGEKHQAEIPDILPQHVIERERGKVKGDEDSDDDSKENGLQIDEGDGDKDVKPPSRIRRHSQSNNGVYETKYESVVYHPHHSLVERDIDQFLIVARAVGTFSRALDASSAVKLPSLHMTAAAASRDVALFHAMAILHQAKYDIGEAVKYLVPPPSRDHYPLDADKVTGHNTSRLGGPILCRDQLEEWSASEATLFEEAVDKCGKDFHDIRNDCLPWKSMSDIIEYYYMWKTTGRYAEMSRNKLAERENKLKQVYIPNYNKPNPSLIGQQNTTSEAVPSNVPCESCKSSESLQWYNWGPAHLQLRLCNDCWTNWKKHAGLKQWHEYEAYDLDGAADMSASRNALKSGSGGRNQSALGGKSNGVSGKPSQHLYQNAKGGGAFYLLTNYHARIARSIAPRSLFNVRKAARSPNAPIDGQAISNYYYSRDLADVVRFGRQLKLRQANSSSELPEAAVEILTKLHKQHSTKLTA